MQHAPEHASDSDIDFHDVKEIPAVVPFHCKGDVVHADDFAALRIDDLLVKQIVPSNLDARLLSFVRTPKKRVRTATYCGPDRRRSPRNATAHKRRSTDKAPVF